MSNGFNAENGGKRMKIPGAGNEWCREGFGEITNVCCLGIKGGFCEKLVLRVGGDEADLPGNAQEMKGKGGTPEH